MPLTAFDVAYIFDTIEFDNISLPNNCNSEKFKVVSPDVDNKYLKVNPIH